MEIVNCESPEQEHFDRAGKSVRLVIIYRAIRRIEQALASPSQIARPEPLREPHKTSPVLVWADVDQAIVALVRYLNTIPGVRTLASCQGTIGEGGPNPYPAQVMATWPTEVAERLHIEFYITELGTNWGYIHPKGANEWGGNGESQTARPDERNEDGNTAISTLRPVAIPAAQPLQVSAEQPQLDAGMDWEQVRLNGGPPCFHEEGDGRLCGRAKHWHEHPGTHKYVSFEAYGTALAEAYASSSRVGKPLGRTSVEDDHE